MAKALVQGPPPPAQGSHCEFGGIFEKSRPHRLANKKEFMRCYASKHDGVENYHIEGGVLQNLAVTI